MTEKFSDPSRRTFLRGAAVAGVGAMGAGAAKAATPDPLITEVQPWAQELGDGVDAVRYGLPIEYEGDVVRRNVEWLTADTISSINFTPIHALDGTITPQGCAFERHHSGAIDLKKEDYRLMVNGKVDRPLVFSYADLERFPRQNQVNFCECAANTGMEWAGAQLNGVQFTHGMIHNMEYTGVPLRTLLEEAGADLNAKWVFVEGADASSNGRSIPMEKALDDCLIAFKANGEALRKEHGYPVRGGKPRGNLEIHRHFGRWHEPQMDLGDGCEICCDQPKPASADHPWPRAAGDHGAGMVGQWRDHAG